MGNVHKTKYITIIISVTFIFLLGILIGKILTEISLSSYTNTASFLKVQALSLGLQHDLISQNVCNIDIFKITKERASLGAKVDELEKSLGKTNPQMIALKQEYTLISLRQWLLVKEAKEKCGLDVNIILYFYSNTRNQYLSELQGYVLDYLYRKYTDKIVTYSFDSDLEEPTLTTIMELYNITEIPSVVLNEKLYPGYRDREDIEPLIIK